MKMPLCLGKKYDLKSFVFCKKYFYEYLKNCEAYENINKV